MKFMKKLSALVLAVAFLSTFAALQATATQNSSGISLGSTTPTSGNILIGSGTQFVTRALSGDVTVNSTGVTAIGATKVTNAMLAGSINLTTKVTGTLPTANGGTGNAFFTVSGPATSAKTFTFPNASSTVLTSNAAVTVAQGGTGLATLTANNVILGNGTSTPTFVAPSTSGNVLTSNGTTWTSATPSGAVPTGGVVNTISYAYTTNGPTGTTALPMDDTIPQITEGNQVFNQNYTMASTTNKLRVMFQGAASGTNTVTGCALFVAGGANAVAAGVFTPNSVNLPGQVVVLYEFVPATVSAQAYEIRCGNNGGTAVRFNGTTTGRLFGGVSNTTLTFTEIKA